MSTVKHDSHSFDGIADNSVLKSLRYRKWRGEHQRRTSIPKRIQRLSSATMESSNPNNPSLDMKSVLIVGWKHNLLELNCYLLFSQRYRNAIKPNQMANWKRAVRIALDFWVQIAWRIFIAIRFSISLCPPWGCRITMPTVICCVMRPANHRKVSRQ